MPPRAVPPRAVLPGAESSGVPAPLLDELAGRLGQLEERHLRRRLELPEGVDFASNDYLALASHPRAARSVADRLARISRPTPVEDGHGAPGSRLLRGHRDDHSRLEARLAAWKGTEAALLFPSGWQANAGLLTALIGPGDRVLSDSLNHASIIDALRLTRSTRVIYPHLDLDAVAHHLGRPHPTGRTLLVTESLFSMDGDVAPLDRLAELCERHGAELIVDDAHATGLYGARGSGLVEHFGVATQVAAVVSTGGKALGFAGAFVAGARVLCDYLVNVSRPFVFSTAVPPLAVWALEAALDALEAEPWRRRRVLELADHLRRHLAARGVEVAGQGPVVPVIVGANRAALTVARSLREQGYDVRAVRPPTVPEGTARLRISVHADHDPELLERLAADVVGALDRVHAAAAVPAAARVSVEASAAVPAGASAGAGAER